MFTTRQTRSSLRQIEELKKKTNEVDEHHNEDDDSLPEKQRFEFNGIEFSTYQDMVEAKRKRNHDVLVKSGLIDAVTNIKKIDTAAQEAKRRQKLERIALATRRKSNRLAGVQSDGLHIRSRDIADTTTADTLRETYFQDRVNDGSDLTIRQAMELREITEDDSVEKAETFVKEVLAPLCQGVNRHRGKQPSSPQVVAESDAWRQTLIAQIAALSVNDEKCVGKVTQSHVHSIAAHPSTDRLIVAAGDRFGIVGVWHVADAQEDQGSEGHLGNVYQFPIYNKPVCFVHWTQDNGLLSASYDGSVRKLDVTTGIFHEIFATYDGDSKYAEDLGYGLEDVAKGADYWVQSLTPDHHHDPDLCFFLSTSVGTAIHVDLRVGRRKVTFQEFLSEKKINTLSLHPNGFSLASAGLDGTMRIWDVRKLGGPSSRNNHKKTLKAISEYQVGRSINSAYFSPNGSTVVATTMANTLDIVKAAHLASNTIQAMNRVKHDNITGRWLSTFMARWHPSLEIFVVGSMSKPRRMEIFDSDGNLLRGVQGDALTAVTSRCCFHPSADQLIMFGSNASGRVTVIR